MSSVAAIVLAAGRGTRFGPEPKLLAPLGGKPLVRHAVEAALASGLARVLVVTGHRATEVEAALSGLGASFVRNPDYPDGLSTSLRAGFAALPRTSEAAAILLGDMPAVGPGLVRRLAEAWAAAGCPPALVPTYRGRRGNPVVLSKALAPEIAALRGDEGAGPLLRRMPGVVELATDEEPSVALDVDTPAALAALPAQASTTPSSTAE